MELLAIAYNRSGDIDKSEEIFRQIGQLTTGRLYFGDIYVKSFYKLGKIYEQKGWAGKAIEHYEKFLDLWKDADPGLAEVEDAKKRLSSLQSK
jgi:tetratricopeptide (TPR) repeat protein